MLTSSAVPAGFTVCPATLADVEAITRLINICEIAELGFADVPLEEIRAFMSAPRLNLATDTWKILDAAGQLVAYANHSERQHAFLGGNVWVRPDFQGRGLGTYLLHHKETRAVEEIALASATVRVVSQQLITDGNTRALALLAQHGYAPIRHFWRMEIELSEALSVPFVGGDLTIRPFILAQDAYPVYEAMEEAFQDHWGHTPRSFEEFRQFHIERADFDATQWFVAEVDGQIAGALIGRHYSPTYGYVGTLGVRRAWRGRGIARALLQTSFAAFQRAGKTKVGLGVDATNSTGATRVYERAGMRVAWQSTSMEKELRPGNEPSAH